MMGANESVRCTHVSKKVERTKEVKDGSRREVLQSQIIGNVNLA